MAAEMPAVRLFVACEEIQVEPGSLDVSLQKVFHRIVRLPGEPFPCVCEQMALYAMLANGRGEHEFCVELAYWDQGDERSLFRSASRRVDLGPDPLVVHGLPIPNMRVKFDGPGQYSFYLLCDGQRIAEYQVEVR